MPRPTQKQSTDRPVSVPGAAPKRNPKGLPWKRYFTRPGVPAFDEVQWQRHGVS